jgi:glycosyltransferase involved in cell wall biosynthesis
MTGTPRDGTAMDETPAREPLRVLVVTVVHDPRDARILHREIAALLDAGHRVTYVAPFSSENVPPPPGVRAIDVPRSAGRRRLTAVTRARQVVRREGHHHDVVLLHDPELLASVVGLDGPTVVWDVHEDTAAALSLKSWLPVSLRGVTATVVRRVERGAESRVRLILAEEGYRDRFAQEHPVVPNSTVAPETAVPSGADRVVYVGALTEARGVREMVEVGRLLADEPIAVHLVGPADESSTALLLDAQDKGWVEWHGFLPNDRALALVDGALAGLSLLHDEPNYRHSRPTKVIEYMAHGVPVITSPTPPSRVLVEGADCGFVVGFGDARAAADSVRALVADPAERQAKADRGRAAALRDHDWRQDGARFVQLLEGWAREDRARR